MTHHDEDAYLICVRDMTDTQMLQEVLRTQREILRVVNRLEIRMATLEEVTAALGAAVDRIGTLLGETIAAKDAAQQAASDAQAALDAANAADAVEDAAAAQQISDLQTALQAATDALNASVAASDAAVTAIQSNVDELNALGPQPEPTPEG